MSAPRQLNLFDATMLVMGGIIGVGIFFNPQGVAQHVPTAGPYFAMWILGGVAALAGAMTFAELAATFPRTGGWFVFLREAFGPFPAFLFAWIALFVVSTGASAVVADFCATQITILVWGPGAAPANTPIVIGVMLLLGITALALAGVKSAALFQNACMVLKLIAIGAFVLGGVALASTPFLEAFEATPPPDAPGTGRGMIRASLPVLFSYGGWQLVTYIAPNVKDPQRTLPRAILLGVLGVVAVYLATNFAFVRVLGMDGVRTLDGFAAEMATRTFGSAGGTLLVAAMSVSALGICTAILLATPGVYVAMAREGLFFAAFGRLHPRTGAPVAALLVQGAVVIGYFLWRRAGVLTDAVVFAEWIFHCLCGLALLRLRARRPDLPRPFRSWFYPLFPILYSGLAGSVVVGAILQADPEKTWLGLGVLAVGAAIYRPWRALVRTKHPRGEAQ